MQKKRSELESLKVTELKTMAKEQGIKGYSKLNKNNLVEKLMEAEEKEVPYSEMKPQDITPEIAIRAMMGSMKNHPYYLAAVNLYGVITKEEMSRIIAGYTGEKISQKEMTEDLKNNITFAGQYCLYGDYIVSDLYRESNMQGVVELIEASSKYKKYIPDDKEEFLKYQNGMYYERTEAIDNLEKYLEKKFASKFTESSDVVEAFIDSTHMYCVNQTIMDDYSKLCEEFGLVTDNEEQNKKLQDLIMDVYYNTRLWGKNGHTFAECEGMGESVESGTQKSFEDIKKEFASRAAALANRTAPKEVKVGRNDLCPCGSGLKYKKCCGKNV